MTAAQHLLLMCLLVVHAGAAWGQQPAVSFNRDIRPIMSDTCFRCHGPDKSSRMMGLRLDIREEALKRTPTKVIPIVPGKPEESAIIQRIFSTNPARVMPPPSAHKELTAAQKETIRRWVAEGAVYEGHWAYEPVRRPTPPVIPRPLAPVRNSIDAFIQQRLARERLSPSPEANKRTLIRRVTLDLTGLPPTSGEVAAFLKDTSPRAYEKVVDRLLASPRYAERMATHWLDVVRYADTRGFHGDNPIPVWPYRDYVLRAFRENKPFDEFTREQIAGDLLPHTALEQRATADSRGGRAEFPNQSGARVAPRLAALEQRVAAAYNRLNRTSAEGGLQPAEYLAKYGADRVRTLGSAWMGATLGCAECHDHKFDPITAKDFYSMKAFFADIKEDGLVHDRYPNSWEYLLPLPSPAQQQQLEELESKICEAREALLARSKELMTANPAWERELMDRYQRGELAWKPQVPVAAAARHGATLTVFDQELVSTAYEYRGSIVSEKKPGKGLVVASGANPDNETYVVEIRPGPGKWTALGIEVVQDDLLPGNRVSRGADRFVLTEVSAMIESPAPPGGRALRFSLAVSNAAHPMPEHSPAAAIDGNPATGWGIGQYGESLNPFLALRFAGKLETTAGTVIKVSLAHDSASRRATIGRFRIHLSAGEHSWPSSGSIGLRDPNDDGKGLPGPVLQALAAAPAQRTAAQEKAIAEYFRFAASETLPLLAELSQLEAAKGRLEAAIPRVVATESVEPAVTRILPRGNFLDESGAVVEPAVPAFLGKLNTSGRATRLDLANWLVSPGNPLTARVFVNRLWRLFFGTGITKTLDDLGSQGEWPTHPELLDWLAAEFMSPTADPRAPSPPHAWDVKHMVRLIVTSHTYRQSSLPSPALETRDPDNRLLARQSRFRVDAEVVRDIALAVSGLLVESFGGPPVRPVQPDGYLAALNFPKRDYSASRGADLYRRSLYTHWQRSYLHPTLLTFDAPPREECTVNRVSSNTPLQALVLLNDPIFVEASRVFAARILRQGGASLLPRLDWAFRQVLNRPPRPAERDVLAGLFRKAKADYRKDPAAARQLIRTGEAVVEIKAAETDLAAMTIVARALFNLHETITRN